MLPYASEKACAEQVRAVVFSSAVPIATDDRRGSAPDVADSEVKRYSIKRVLG